jgi:hypothetical protein
VTPEQKRRPHVVVVNILRCRWEKVVLNTANEIKIETIEGVFLNTNFGDLCSNLNGSTLF